MDDELDNTEPMNQDGLPDNAGEGEV